MQTPISEPANLQTDGMSRQAHLWPVLIGAYFSFRISITFLWFQSNPVTGNAVTHAIGMAILVGTICYAVDERPETVGVNFIPTTVKWIGALLSFALLSLMWTVTQSYVAALGYWVGLFTDVSIVWLIARRKWDSNVVYSLLAGFVWGSCAVAVIAWLSPTAADMRLGNEEFMHPNVLGWEFALATVFSQYLSRWRAPWRWVTLAMVITQVRTLSKTSLAAFAIAETFYVLYNARLSRKTRIYIGIGAIVIIVCFWGWLEAYTEIYASEGNSIETLTGRTILWSEVLSMALEQPWIGHGIHSFRALVPALGTFEPWHAHNEILHQFFVYGALGVAIVMGVYWSFFQLAQRSRSSELRLLAFTILIMALIRGLADTENFDLSFPLWLLTLLSFGLSEKANIGEVSYG
jgi:exopolysaccharide production protein ExoQ